MISEDIISKLPYSKPFLFVDEITSVSEEGVTGNFKYVAESDFYKGHFKDNPITPGVILTETMAQIGLVSLGIFLLSKEGDIIDEPKIAMTSTSIDFYIPVYPNEKVEVISEKEYFRFGKLKCKVKMLNSKGELVCRGTISGMMKTSNEN